MKRRDFVKFLGIGTAAVAVAPLALLPKKEEEVWTNIVTLGKFDVPNGNNRLYYQILQRSGII